MKLLPAAVTSILVMPEILFVSVYAYVFFGDGLIRTELIGALLVMMGALTLIERHQRTASDG